MLALQTVPKALAVGVPLGRLVPLCTAVALLVAVPPPPPPRSPGDPVPVEEAHRDPVGLLELEALEVREA